MNSSTAISTKGIPLLKLIALCVPLAAPLSVTAANVTWTPQVVAHTDLAQPADVSAISTAGTLVAAVKVGGAAATVNGVPFAAGTGNITSGTCNWSVPNVSWGNNGGGYYATNASAPANSADTWLTTGKWHGSTTPGQLNMLGLTVGNQYRVQLIFADVRTIYGVDGRTVSVDGGTTRHQYAFCPSGGPYGYLVLDGVFIADATSQSVDMQCYAPSGGAAIGPQLNAFQFRDLGLPTVSLTPTFNLSAGTYIGARTVTLECGTPGSTIYYTTNGDTPTNASPSGASGVQVNIQAGTTLTLNAYSHADGFTDSSIASATYTTLAQTSGTWTNAAGGSWPVASNWLGNAIPFAGTANFSTLALPGDTQVTLDGGQTIGHLVLGDTGASHDWYLDTGTGGPLTLDAGVNPPSITVNNRTSHIDAVLAGTNGMSKAGNGTLALTGANTFTGATTVTAGTLRVTNLDSYRSSTAISSGAILEANVAGNVNAANSYTISGSGSLVKTGTGTWLIGSVGRVGISMNAGGLVNIQGGMIQCGSHQGSWSGNQGSVNIATGATLDIAAENVSIDALTGTGSLQNSYLPSGTRTTTVGIANGSGTFNGIISSSVLALAKTGTGTQILTGDNTYTGATTISGGTLQLGNGGTSGSLSTSSAITCNGTLAFNRSDNISQGIHFRGNSIGGTGGLTQKGPGTLTLTTNNSYAGTTALTGGGLAIGLPRGSIWNVPALDLADGTTLTLRNFDSNSGNPAANVTASLTTAGTVTLKVEGTFTVGTVPLLYYPVDSEIGGDGFAALTLGTLPDGVIARLVPNEGNFSVDLEITAVAGYQGWITGFTFEPGADTTTTGDPDHDGLANGLEYALGLLPNQSDGSPGTFLAGEISFTKGVAAFANDDVTYVIETSDDLGLTDPWAPAVTHAPPHASQTISYILPTPTKFARLKVINH